MAEVTDVRLGSERIADKIVINAASGDLNVNSGTIVTHGQTNSGKGMYSFDSNICIIGGDVTAIGDTAEGIYAYSETKNVAVSITGGMVRATGKGFGIVAGTLKPDACQPTINIGGTADVTAISSASGAIYATGNVSITGGKVEATAQESGYPGIRSTRGNLIISGTAAVNAVSKAIGLSADVGGLEVKDTAVVTSVGDAVDAAVAVTPVVADTAELNALVRETAPAGRTFTAYGTCRLRADISLGATEYKSSLPQNLVVATGATLVLQGTSTVIGKNSAIHANGNLTVSGTDGILKAGGTDGANGRSIEVTGTLTVDSGTILSAGNYASMYANAIEINDGTIDLGAHGMMMAVTTLTISGGKVKTGGSVQGSIFATNLNGGTVRTSITITGGTVIANGGNHQPTPFGILAMNGTISITENAVVTATGRAAAILTSDGTITDTVTPPAPKPQPPKTDPSTGNTEVSVPVKPVTRGDTSSATVPEKSVSDAIAAAEKEAAKTGGSASVTVTVDAPKGAKTVETTLSGKSLSAVAGGKTISNFNGGTATITVPYTLKEGENPEFITVWLLDDAGKLIPIEANYADGKITFETSHFSRYAIGYLPFTDVKADWSYESIVYAYQNKLFSGVGDDKFAPADNMNRAMLWTVLYRMAGSPDKTENPANWYADAQAWAMANGISDGKNPDGNVTREQLATILFRYAKATAAS